MASKIKLRRGTKQQWIDAYPIILDIGEPGLELDTGKVKYGDNLTEWQNLPYSSEPLPNQLGNGGKYLTTNGNGVLSWVSIVDDDSLYVTSTSLTSTLSNYALTTSLSGYVSSSALGHYTFTADGGDTITNSSVQNINLKTGTRSWTFGTDGTTQFPNYTFPAARGAAGQVLIDNGSGVLSWGTVTGSGNANTGNFTFITNQLSVSNTNNITLATNGKTWTFGSNGTTTLPTGGSISIGPGNSTAITDADGVAVGIDATHYVSVGLPSTIINSNGNSWTFGSNGVFTLPTSGSISRASLGLTALTDGDGVAIAVNTTNYIVSSPLNAVISSDNKRWQFNNDGSFTLPTNWTFAANGNLSYSQTGSIIHLGTDAAIEFQDNANTILQSGPSLRYYQYGGTLASGGGHKFYTGGARSSQTHRLQIADDGLKIRYGTHLWIFDDSGKLTLPQSATIADTGNSVVIKPNHLASDFQLEIKAYDDVITPDDIHIRATDPDHGLTLGDSNGGSYVSINGDLHDNEIIVSTINKNNEERKEFVFDVEGHLHVPGDVQVSSIGAFRNSSGVRAAYVNEIPTDVSDLTDNSGIISAGQQLAEISIDGGHALAFFATPIAADGGGSAGRFGPNSIVFNGGFASGGTYGTVLNGGGA
jgi:hypothetical protein